MSFFIVLLQAGVLRRERVPMVYGCTLSESPFMRPFHLALSRITFGLTEGQWKMYPCDLTAPRTIGPFLLLVCRFADELRLLGSARAN